MITEGQQLEMFLTAKQEQMIERYVKNNQMDFERAKNDAEQKNKFLTENGFVEGIHFKNTFKFEKNVTETTILGGRWYDVEEFEAEVTITQFQGGVFLLHDVVELEDGERKIVKKDTYFSITRDNKIECSTIVGSYRAVKPSTLLSKINDMFSAAKEQLGSLIVKDLNFNLAISQLKHEFPTAVSVEKRNEWIRTNNFKNSYTKDVIVVMFENGSYIQYDLDYKGEKRIFKIYDAEEIKMTSEQKVERLVKRIG